MKKFIVFDIVCYVVLPYFIWNYGREPLGDYYAMLLSTIPGFFYTIYRFAIERQFNIAGISILLSLFLGTMINLLSQNAESMLWNQVYLGYAYGMIFLISVLIRKPLALRFAVDFVYLQGFAKEDSFAAFSKKGVFM
ncbi:VC0807 family protein [Planococcus salinarum]|uniref:VC0807 family protein n=1 Tax=Planococcus salinarum TaxID=622695 RepID=UPI001E63691F|nr:VC0807 family protein [Planococcus salinarum]